jgi:hypothetical protein
MADRGRPKNPSSFVIRRWLCALLEFDRAKLLGEKHSGALGTAAAEMLKKYPHLKVSQTEIRRMLAKWRAPNAGMTFLCRELSSEEGTAVMPDGTVLRFPLQVKVGPRPNYVRHNKR